MELHIIDRLAIPALLPKEGNFKQYNLKKSILSKIEIGEQEREEVNLRQNPETNRIEWDTEKDTPLTILFSHEEMEFLLTRGGAKISPPSRYKIICGRPSTRYMMLFNQNAKSKTEGADAKSAHLFIRSVIIFWVCGTFFVKRCLYLHHLINHVVKGEKMPFSLWLGGIGFF